MCEYVNMPVILEIERIPCWHFQVSDICKEGTSRICDLCEL